MDEINFLLSLFPNVLKSLLIVLGTLPSPAVNWPWKVPPCRVNAPCKAWITPKNGVTHTFHRPTTTTAASPALLLVRLGYSMPQEVRTMSSPPACCATNILFLFMSDVPRRAPASFAGGSLRLRHPSGYVTMRALIQGMKGIEL